MTDHATTTILSIDNGRIQTSSRHHLGFTFFTVALVIIYASTARIYTHSSYDTIFWHPVILTILYIASLLLIFASYLCFYMFTTI